jgi:hypothetical protein
MRLEHVKRHLRQPTAELNRNHLPDRSLNGVDFDFARVNRHFIEISPFFRQFFGTFDLVSVILCECGKEFYHTIHKVLSFSIHRMQEVAAGNGRLGQFLGKGKTRARPEILAPYCW